MFILFWIGAPFASDGKDEEVNVPNSSRKVYSCATDFDSQYLILLVLFDMISSVFLVSLFCIPLRKMFRNSMAMNRQSKGSYQPKRSIQSMEMQLCHMLF